MKEIRADRLETLEALAMEGAKQIKAFFAYQGEDRTYLQKAKLGAAVITGYSRLRASETNRMAVELASARLDAPLPELPRPRRG